MTATRIRFPFRTPVGGTSTAMPIVAARLTLHQSVVVDCLVDSGATINVLPYSVGIQLGAAWNQQTVRVPLGGILAGREARAILADIQIGSLNPVRLAFAWVDTDDVPVLLGQTNFFQQFDVCLFRSRGCFEVGLKQ